MQRLLCVLVLAALVLAGRTAAAPLSRTANPAELVRLAKRYAADGKLRKVRPQCAQLDPAAHNNAKQALALLQDAVRHDPDSADARCEIGRVLLRAGEPNAAERALRRCTLMRTDPGDDHMTHGIALLGLRRYGEAADALRTALRVSRQQRAAPTRAISVRTLLGAALRGDGDLEAAERELRKAVTQATQQAHADAQLHMELGMTLAARQRWAEAVEQFEVRPIVSVPRT